MLGEEPTGQPALAGGRALAIGSLPMTTHRALLAITAMALACGGRPAPPAQRASTEPESSLQDVISLPSGDLEAAIGGAHRTIQERMRDGSRHPRRTLEFFGLTPAMTVLEIWPGQGWYTKILAPYLRGSGQLIVADFDPATEGALGEMVRDLHAMLDAAPTLYGEVHEAGLYPGHLLEEVPDESVDLVLLPRTLHNWVRRAEHDPAAYLDAIARVLRTGGVLGVVQHRAPEGHPAAETGETGYLSESFVIRMAAAAGLELEERSEVNANRRDVHDHPDGVWSLPPTLQAGERDEGTFEGIGESDRMTLRFRKVARDDDDDDD